MKYVLAGGVAANLHGSVRATKDVDILVPRDLKNTERLLAALAALPYGVSSELDPNQVSVRPITIVGDDPRVDVLTVAWNLTYADALKKRRVRRIFGVRVPYVGLDDLIRSKQTGRPQDDADLEALRAARPRRRTGTR